LPVREALSPSPPRAGDSTGESTLELFRENEAYTRFLWERLSRLAGREVTGRILEVGCGIGNLTRVILRTKDVRFLHAIDMEPVYVDRLLREVPDPRLRATVSRAEDFAPPEYREPGRGFDFIVSSNVLEHIEDDAGLLSRLSAMLAPGGRILLLVPAHPWLYSSLDRQLSHFRRYRARDFRALASRLSLRIEGLRHFNPLGILGWWWNGKVLHRSILPSGQLALYARFALPASRLLDRLNPFPIGISLLLALGRRG
jgi:SAM-dependent methyltransferase